MTTARSLTRRRLAPSRALAGVVGTAVVLSLGTAPGVAVAPTAARASAAISSAAPTADSAASGPLERRRTNRFGKLRVGISTGFSIQYDTKDRIGKDFTAAKRFGAQQIRLDLNWALVQPERDVVDWARTDLLFSQAKAKHLKVLAVVGLAPDWAKLPDGSVDPAKFGDFVDAAARRYASKVAAWEIWNEPNQQPRWSAKVNPAQYARVVEAAAPGIRRHDPKAPILMGALAPAVDGPVELSPITFLEGVYRAGIDRSSYDAISVHPFSYPALPSGDEEWNTFNRLGDIHDVAKRNGDGAKPFWLTEYGARTGSSDRSVGYRRHTQLMVDAYRQTKKLRFVQALFFYSLRDASSNRSEPEDNFGLLKFDGTPKPAYKVLRRELRRDR